MKLLVRFNYGDYYIFPTTPEILNIFENAVRVEEKGSYDNQSWVISGKGQNIDLKLVDDDKVVDSLPADAMKVLEAAEAERSKAQSKVWGLESEIAKLKKTVAEFGVKVEEKKEEIGL